LQWAYEQQLTDVVATCIITGWAATEWQQRVDEGEAFAKRCGFTTARIKAQHDFTALVIDRGSFPSRQFPWCAGFLKGLNFIAWADRIDLGATATVLIGSRRADSRLRASLPEFIEDSEHYGDRRVWHPLYCHTDSDRDALLQRAGFAKLGHPSRECAPCIHSGTADDLRQLSGDTIQRLANLERNVGKSMFNPADIGGSVGIKAASAWAQQHPQQQRDKSRYMERFDKGCGAAFACGE